MYRPIIGHLYYKNLNFNKKPNEPNSIKVLKIVEPTIRTLYYLKTSVINSAMSPPSLVCKSVFDAIMVPAKCLLVYVCFGEKVRHKDNSNQEL